jgi:hypothetical protein
MIPGLMQPYETQKQGFSAELAKFAHRHPIAPP